MLYYCHIAHGNFGDALNPWLWSRLAPEVCDTNPARRFLAIGTILSRTVPAAPFKVVFGSGTSGDSAPALDEKWFVYCVRGPLTAAKLNLDARLALTDPAVLVRRVPLTPQRKIHRVSFMPHHRSAFEADWSKLCARIGMHCIDPRRDVEQVLAELQQTELLVTEAMHGAIVADALRVPWIPVRLYGHFTEFKWRDWTESVQVPLALASVPPVYERGSFSRKGVAHAFKKAATSVGLGKSKWKYFRIRPSRADEIAESVQALAKLAMTGKPQLSDEATIQRLEARLFETLGQIRAAWPRGDFKPPQR